MSAKKKRSDAGEWFAMTDKLLMGVDRLALFGRRGTGKSVGVKKYIEAGHVALVVANSKEQAESAPVAWVKPNETGLLSDPEGVDYSIEGSPVFRVGDGFVRVMSINQIIQARVFGAAVAGRQPDLIIQDEVIRVDGRYPRNAPELLDDLAYTIGRSGDVPKVVVIGNPIDNRNPYAWRWRINSLIEGDYRDPDGVRITRVCGTSACRDCFGRKIGIDAGAPTEYAPKLTTGGDVLTVNGRSIRVMLIGDWLYVGDADEPGVIIADGGRLTRNAIIGEVGRFLNTCRIMLSAGTVVYSSYDAELTFLEMLGQKP